MGFTDERERIHFFRKDFVDCDRSLLAGPAIEFT